MMNINQSIIFIIKFITIKMDSFNKLVFTVEQNHHVDQHLLYYEISLHHHTAGLVTHFLLVRTNKLV